ncbi:MAG TPA: hypothetical protein VKB81_19100 [Nitrospira sp.]|nr:hypothetical protein [Nitrospira sp.]
MNRAKPKFVWFILAYYPLGIIITLYNFSRSLPATLSLKEGLTAHFATLSFFESAVAIVSILLSSGGLIALFFLRAIAAKLFLTSWMIYVSFWIYDLISTSPLAGESFGGLAGTFSGFALNTFIVYYVHRLKNQGVLR